MLSFKYALRPQFNVFFSVVLNLKYIAVLVVFLSGNCFAINCKLASSKVEIAICSNKELLELDDEMSKIYRRMSSYNQGNRNALRSQLNWISSRGACESRSDINDCIRRFTEGRIAELNGKDALKGSERYLINIVGENYNGDDYSKYSFSYPLIISPATDGEKRFNSDMEKEYKPQNDKLMRYSISKNDGWSFLESSYNVLFNNSKYLEIGFYYSSMGSSAAHPNHGSGNRHFDIKKGRVMSSADMLMPASLYKIYNACIKQLAKSQESELQEYESYYGESVKRSIADVVNWVIYPQSASIVFDPYVAAPYSEGTQSCKVSEEELRESLTNYMLELLNP